MKKYRQYNTHHHSLQSKLLDSKIHRDEKQFSSIGKFYNEEELDPYQNLLLGKIHDYRSVQSHASNQQQQFLRDIENTILDVDTSLLKWDIKLNSNLINKLDTIQTTEGILCFKVENELKWLKFLLKQVIDAKTHEIAHLHTVELLNEFKQKNKTLTNENLMLKQQMEVLNIEDEDTDANCLANNLLRSSSLLAEEKPHALSLVKRFSSWKLGSMHRDKPMLIKVTKLQSKLQKLADKNCELEAQNELYLKRLKEAIKSDPIRSMSNSNDRRSTGLGLFETAEPGTDSSRPGRLCISRTL